MTPEAKTQESGESIGFVGAGVEAISWPEEVLRDVSYGPFAAVPVALSETWADTRLTLVAIKKMVTSFTTPSKLSVGSRFPSRLRRLDYELVWQ